jgi:hypothetical protein
MWELSNRTRFAAERAFARDRDGAEVLLVVVKATFALGPDGALRVADEQVPVARVPRHAGEPGRSSLLHEADFALGKRATDVLATGHAHALQGKPTIAVEARVRIGAWQKRVLAVGDRRWERGMTGWRLSDPEPFTSMPLAYERAFGGADRTGRELTEYAANPVGIGFAREAADLAGRAAPNLEDPSDLLRSPDQRPRPMSFGPIAREWPERRRLAGTYDERWRRERRPLVPGDFDDAFWQSAPPDQQASLEGGEPVELKGLHPRGVLRFELPRIRPSFRTRLGGQVVEHAASLHTVIFEADEDRVVLVFQSALPCHHEIQSLEQTVVREVA